MGVAIVADTSRPRPYPIRLLVACDGDHGFLPATASFAYDEGVWREPAVQSGWRFTGEGRVLCPSCARSGGGNFP